jgi:hypothetical protein
MDLDQEIDNARHAALRRIAGVPKKSERAALKRSIIGGEMAI